MNINEIRIYRENDGGALKGFVNITLNSAISIKGIKIIETEEKRFIVMPSREFKGVLNNVAFPINQDTRSKLERLVLGLYDEMVNMDLMFIEREYDSDCNLYINDIKVDKHLFQNSVKAVFDIVVDGEYVLKGIKLLYKNDHYFITMPNHLVKDKYIDYYHPINMNIRHKLEQLLIEIYTKSTEGISHFKNHTQKDIMKTSLLDFVY